MSAGLVQIALPEVLSLVVDNRGKSCPTVAEGFPLIATNCLKPGRRTPVFENIRYIDDRTYESWFRAHPEPADVLFVCKGSPGRVAVVPDPVPFCIAQDMVALRANREVIDPGYLYYRVLASDVQSSISQMHVGTMIPHFKKGDFGRLRFTIHRALEEQREIADVLEAFDNKIAVNERIAVTALDLAETLFRGIDSQNFEWFPLGKLATTTLGGTPSRARAEFWTGGTVPWIASGKANEERILKPSEWITRDALATSAAKLMPCGATVVAITGATLGQIARLEIQASGNQSLVGIWHDDPALNDWVYFAVRQEVGELVKSATGAAQQHVNKGAVDALRIPVPSREVLQSWGRIVRPLLNTAAATDRESVLLAETRDKLLPLLMSGRVRASGPR